MFTTIGLFGNRCNLSTFFCWYFTLFFCAFSFFLCLLLNHTETRKEIEKLVGLSFVDRFFVNNLKGFLPFLLFSLAFVAPMLLEEYSYFTRTLLYQDIMDPLKEAYCIHFLEGGGVLGDLQKTGKVEKPVSTPEMITIYKLMKSHVKPANGVVIEYLRRFGL